MQNDMNTVITPKSDQINADDLIGGPMTITVSEVQIKGGQEQPVSIYFEGSNKAFRPCKSMSRVLVQAWGPDANKYRGRSITLYRDPSVKWGGMEVGGIRISHLTDIASPITMALTATKGQRKPYVVRPLVIQTSPADAARAMLADKASQGMKALEAAWNSLPAQTKKTLASELPALKQRASERDIKPTSAPENSPPNKKQETSQDDDGDIFPSAGPTHTAGGGEEVEGDYYASDAGNVAESSPGA